jgi:hypothetical protein
MSEGHFRGILSSEGTTLGVLSVSNGAWVRLR